MAIDVRQLRPSMLTRMLNSTPMGEVLSERQLRRHRNRAGLSHWQREARRPAALRRVAGLAAPQSGTGEGARRLRGDEGGRSHIGR